MMDAHMFSCQLFTKSFRQLEKKQRNHVLKTTHGVRKSTEMHPNGNNNLHICNMFP